MAEEEGFEPSIRLHVYTLSRRAPSTTRTPLRITHNFNSVKHQVYSQSGARMRARYSPAPQAHPFGAAASRRSLG